MWVLLNAGHKAGSMLEDGLGSLHLDSGHEAGSLLDTGLGVHGTLDHGYLNEVQLPGPKMIKALGDQIHLVWAWEPHC